MGEVDIMSNSTPPQSYFGASGRTAWWRLIHSKLPHQIRMNRRQSEIYADTICSIYKSVPEDDFHLFVGCRKKWPVWREAVKEFLQNKDFESTIDVWQILLLTDYRRIRRDSGVSILSVIGLILVYIWQLHWRCKIDKMIWSPEACLWPARKNRRSGPYT
jgi:hypothetical protein